MRKLPPTQQTSRACLLRWEKFYPLFLLAKAVSSELPPAPKDLRGRPAVISTAEPPRSFYDAIARDFGQVGDHLRDSDANPSSLAASSFLDDSDRAPAGVAVDDESCRSSPTTRLLIVMRHPPKISDPYNFGALFKETSEKPEFAQACSGVKEKCAEYLKKVFVYEASASQVPEGVGTTLYR